MKRKDYLIVALAPLLVLMIPLVGVMTSKDWKWTGSDFLLAWVILALTTFAFRFLATRPMANLPYRAGVGLGVAGGFLMTWVTLAVQIIGDDNPANLFYLLVIVLGLVGIGLARCEPSGMAKTAFTMAGATFLIPVIAFALWPADFSPGVEKVFILNSVFVLFFAGAGLLLRYAATRHPGQDAAKAA